MNIEIPNWLIQLEKEYQEQSISYFDAKLAMEVTLSALKQSLEHQAGGPFSASVWTQKGRLVSLAVNLVVPSGYSLAHAEMLALSRAQESVGSWSLSQGEDPFILVSSCEPCAMCYGGLLWSGVQELYYAATKKDAERLGFDEGRKPSDWITACSERGVTVHSPLMTQEGVSLLQKYQSDNGVVYNP